MIKRNDPKRDKLKIIIATLTDKVDNDTMLDAYRIIANKCNPYHYMIVGMDFKLNKFGRCEIEATVCIYKEGKNDKKSNRL